MQEELRFRNLVLSTQQEASIDGVLVVEEKAKIVSCNRRLVEMRGIPEDMIARSEDEPVLKYSSRQTADPKASLQ